MSSPAADQPPALAESQRQRWVKYGANVVLSIVVAALIGAVLIYFAHRYNRRIDTTGVGLYSLRPQTRSILGSLDQNVTLVSLYPRRSVEADEQDFYQPVVDLLEEYRRSSSRVKVEVIDPQAEPARLDALIADLSSRYGKDTSEYRAALGDFAPLASTLKEAMSSQASAIEGLPLDQVTSREAARSLQLLAATITGLPQRIDAITRRIEQGTTGSLPDFRGLTADVSTELTSLSALLERSAAELDGLPQAGVPQALRDHAAAAGARFKELRQQVEEYLERLRGLGELKLDRLIETLASRSIVVMGENDYKVLPFSSVWQAPPDLASFEPGRRLRMSFAGEQQISTAINSVTAASKPKVTFVRFGGLPMVTPLFGPRAPMGAVADQLRAYNFEVFERDLSSEFARQAEQQGIEVKEATDAELADSIWVVVSTEPALAGLRVNPLGDAIARHLDAGGAVMILAYIKSDEFTDALTPWGIRLRTDRVFVHDKIDDAGRSSDDAFEDAQRTPFIFITSDYGDHPLARPLAALDSLLVPLVQVEVQPAEGVTTTPLIPIPRTIRSWAETEVEQVMRLRTTEYTPGVDVPNTAEAPLFAGAAAERADGGRLVVIGSAQFALDQFINIPDPRLLQRGVLASRFPGNAELFTAGVFWLAGMDTMLAISPTAMEVSRIEPMSPAAAGFWRWGVLGAGLPGAAVLLGVIVYLRRRD